MNKKSKVTQAQLVTENGQPRVWNGDYGPMYFHSLQFENGDAGEYMSKSQTQEKFIVGQEAEYELKPNANPSFPAKIKPVQSNNYNNRKGADPNTMIAAYAKDIVIAYINNGHKVEQSWFKSWADYIKAWVNGDNPTAPSISKPEPQPGDYKPDLPF